MTAGDLYNYRYANFSSIESFARWKPGYCAEKGWRQQDRCAMSPLFSRLHKVHEDANRRIDWWHYSEEVELRPGGDFSPSRMLYPRLLHSRSFQSQTQWKGQKEA